MSKRPSESLVEDGPTGKIARVDDSVPGVVKKTGARRPVLVYRPGESLNQLTEHLTPQGHEDVEVRIPGQFVSSSNHKVKARQLWGSDVYTSDSDLVAVLMHYGYIHHTISSPLRDVAEIRAVVRPLPAQDKYQSVARNSIRSRSWCSPIQGCSFSVEKAWVVTRSGNSYDLSPLSGNFSPVVPTFTPARHERMVTRSSMGPGKQKHSQEVTVVFSMNNDPWIKYSLQAVCDQGLKPHDRTSAKLKSHVMLLETYSSRYELSPSTAASNGQEKFTFAKCKSILSCKEYRKAGIPLPMSHKDVLEDGLLWEDILWGVNNVLIRDKTYPIVRIQFMSIAEEHVSE
eukprot:jgi/Picre1/30792/NNA_006152.t1